MMRWRGLQDHIMQDTFIITLVLLAASVNCQAHDAAVSSNPLQKVLSFWQRTDRVLAETEAAPSPPPPPPPPPPPADGIYDGSREGSSPKAEALPSHAQTVSAPAPGPGFPFLAPLPQPLPLPLPQPRPQERPSTFAATRPQVDAVLPVDAPMDAPAEAPVDSYAGVRPELAPLPQPLPMAGEAPAGSAPAVLPEAEQAGSHPLRKLLQDTAPIVTDWITSPHVGSQASVDEAADLPAPPPPPPPPPPGAPDAIHDGDQVMAITEAAGPAPMTALMSAVAQDVPALGPSASALAPMMADMPVEAPLPAPQVGPLPLPLPFPLPSSAVTVTPTVTAGRRLQMTVGAEEAPKMRPLEHAEYRQTVRANNKIFAQEKSGSLDAKIFATTSLIPEATQASTLAPMAAVAAGSALAPARAVEDATFAPEVAPGGLPLPEMPQAYLPISSALAGRKLMQAELWGAGVATSGVSAPAAAPHLGAETEAALAAPIAAPIAAPSAAPAIAPADLAASPDSADADLATAAAPLAVEALAAAAPLVEPLAHAVSMTAAAPVGAPAGGTSQDPSPLPFYDEHLSAPVQAPTIQGLPMPETYAALAPDGIQNSFAAPAFAPEVAFPALEAGNALAPAGAVFPVQVDAQAPLFASQVSALAPAPGPLPNRLPGLPEVQALGLPAMPELNLPNDPSELLPFTVGSGPNPAPRVAPISVTLGRRLLAAVHKKFVRAQAPRAAAAAGDAPETAPSGIGLPEHPAVGLAANRLHNDYERVKEDTAFVAARGSSFLQKAAQYAFPGRRKLQATHHAAMAPMAASHFAEAPSVDLVAEAPSAKEEAPAVVGPQETARNPAVDLRNEAARLLAPAQAAAQEAFLRAQGPLLEAAAPTLSAIAARTRAIAPAIQGLRAPLSATFDPPVNALRRPIANAAGPALAALGEAARAAGPALAGLRERLTRQSLTGRRLQQQEEAYPSPPPPPPPPPPPADGNYAAGPAVHWVHPALEHQDEGLAMAPAGAGADMTGAPALPETMTAAAGPLEAAEVHAMAPAPEGYALVPAGAAAGIALPLPELEGISVLGLPPLQGLTITVDPARLLAPLSAPITAPWDRQAPQGAPEGITPAPGPGLGPQPLPRPVGPELPAQQGPGQTQGRRLLQSGSPPPPPPPPPPPVDGIYETTKPLIATAATAPAPAPGMENGVGPLPLPMPLPLPAFVPLPQPANAPADAPLAAAPEIPLRALGPVDDPRPGAVATLPAITIPIMGEALQLPALPLQRLTIPVPAMAPGPRGAPMIEVGNAAGVFGSPTEGPVIQRPDGPALAPNDPVLRVQNPFDTSQGVTIAGR